ncbi:MAG: hypothetical protein AAF741_10520 [Bacteroidota bacterium]
METQYFASLRIDFFDFRRWDAFLGPSMEMHQGYFLVLGVETQYFASLPEGQEGAYYLRKSYYLQNP